MSKKIDNPAELSGKDRVEVAAEPTSQAINEMIRSAVKEGMGELKAEMLEEARAKSTEAAQAVLAGKEEKATNCDEANVYGKDFVSMFRAMAHGNMGPEQAEKSNSVNTLAKAAMYLYRAGGNPVLAGDLMSKDKVSDRDLNLMTRAVGAHDFSAGGALLQGDMFDEVVPELLSETALVSDGAIMREPCNGQLTIPYTSSGPTTRHVEENAAANSSDPAFDQLVLTPKQATIVVPASKTFLNSVNRGSQHIERTMRRSLAVDVDEQLIRGTGASSTPQGLRYLANSSNILTVNATVSAANTVADLARCQEAVQNSNVTWRAEDGRYAISPRTWRYLFSLRDSGYYVFKDELVSQGSILGIKVAGQSGRGISAIPENLAVTGSSESEVYFYVTDDLVMAIGEDLRLEMSDSAAYNNSSGTVVAAFSRDQVVFKLVFKYDFGSLSRGHGIAVLSDVDWGA